MSKIPPQAKRVFQGVIFDVYQWEQEMFDGSKSTFEKLRRSNTVEVIPIVGDKILIQEQEQPEKKSFISLPGGRADEGEQPQETGKRELLEETGYGSEDWELWEQLEPYNKIDWTIYWYIARDCKKVQEPQLDAGEKITTKLITFDELVALSDDKNFYGGELAMKLLRLRLEPEKLEVFRKKLCI
jgi:ADP-ribose pyrophosphatase